MHRPPRQRCRYRVVAERSEARYRVREQLAGISFPSDAVGATSAHRRQPLLDAQGRIRPSDSRLTVDLRTLRSDRDRRDNYVRRNTLRRRHPMAVYTPAKCASHFHCPDWHRHHSGSLIGDLRFERRPDAITWDATATFNGKRVSVQAKPPFGSPNSA